MYGDLKDPMHGALLPRAQQGGMNGFLGSPGMAMASQAANNISALRRNQVPNRTPVEAFSEGHRRNQLVENQRLQLMMQQQAADLRTRQTNQQMGIAGSKEKRDANPMYDFDQFVERRGIADLPYDQQLGQFNEFQVAAMKTATDPAGVREYQFFQGLSDDAQSEYLGLKRAGQKYTTGAGGTRIVGPDGSVTVLEGDDSAISGAARAEGATADASNSSKYDWEQVSAATESLYSAEQAYDLADGMRASSQKYLDMLESNDPAAALETGPIDAFLFNVFGVGTEELAQMDADSIETTLQNLQITNLAPVTENELRQVGKMWANIARQETPNKGVLRRAIAKSEQVMRKIERDAKTQGSRLETFGGIKERDRVVNSSGFLRRVYGRESPDGTIRRKGGQ